MTTLLLQISDPHIREPGRLAYGRIETAPYLRQAIHCIKKLPQPTNAIVITGDLTDFGRPTEYAHLRKLLAPLHVPVYLIPGNHDDREQLRRSFPDHSYLGEYGFVQYSVSVGGLQLIALDTVDQGSSSGTLCTRRLAWLEKQLKVHDGCPVIIAMHHPPFETLIGHMDAIGLKKGGQELEVIVARHPNVERIICGHLHRSIQTRFAGTIASTAPSPAHQVCFDLSPTAPSNWVLEPPGFVVHALSTSGRVISHTVASGDFDGPHPFHVGGALID